MSRKQGWSSWNDQENQNDWADEDEWLDEGSQGQQTWLSGNDFSKAPPQQGVQMNLNLGMWVPGQPWMIHQQGNPYLPIPKQTVKSPKGNQKKTSQKWQGQAEQRGDNQQNSWDDNDTDGW